MADTELTPTEQLHATLIAALASFDTALRRVREDLFAGRVDERTMLYAGILRTGGDLIHSALLADELRQIVAEAAA